MGFLSQPSGGSTVNALQALILSQAPDAYYICKDSGSTLADSSGFGRTLTAVGAPIPNASPLVPVDPDGLYVRMPAGGNVYRLLPNPITVPINRSWSVMAICCPLDLTAAVHLFAIGGGAGETEPDNMQVNPRILTTGEFQSFWESGAGVNQLQSSGINMQEGVPALFACVKDASALTVTFFRNGIRLVAISYATEPTGGTGAAVAFGIGDVGTPTQGNCIIGHVAFYDNKVLTPSFIASVARAAGLFGPGFAG